MKTLYCKCNNFIYSIAVILLFLMLPKWAHTQIQGSTKCNSTLGPYFLNETFGSGTATIGPALTKTTTNLFYYNGSCPPDGTYTIAKASPCYGPSWHRAADHTGKADGYFMLINASFVPNDFYVKTITGLCEATIYQFSAWVMNLLKIPGNDPNIKFSIESNGVVLNYYTTGNISKTSNPTWKQYGFYFTVPIGISSVVLRMRNIALGGLGNDLALDDITFRPAGPSIITSVNGFSGTNIITCNRTLKLNSVVANCYLKNYYQWQVSSDDINWTNIPGEINATAIIPPPISGIYFYRLQVSSSKNNINCGGPSNVIKITYLNNAQAQTTYPNICFGQSYETPSGKKIYVQGQYTDTIKNFYGCDSIITTIHLKVDMIPSFYLGNDTLLCSGATMYLHTDNNINNKYIWQDETTTNTFFVQHPGNYTLTGTNHCGSFTSTIKVAVLNITQAVANPKICIGQFYTTPSGNKIFAEGQYQDTIKSQQACDSVITSINLKVDTLPFFTLGNDTLLCSGQTINLQADTSSLNTYTWQDNTSSYKYHVKEPGNYSLTETNNCGSYTAKITVAIKPLKFAQVNANICQGQLYSMPSGKTLNLKGKYQDTLRYSLGCDSIITNINLVVDNVPFFSLGKDITICRGQTIYLYPDDNLPSNYTWQDGSVNKKYPVQHPGTYTLTETNHCGFFADSINVLAGFCKILMPSAFSPNRDKHNDIFKVKYPFVTKSFEFIIYNRWGQVIFKTNNILTGWDGNFKGINQPPDTYIWQISFTDLENNSNQSQGSLVLIR